MIRSVSYAGMLYNAPACVPSWLALRESFYRMCLRVLADIFLYTKKHISLFCRARFLSSGALITRLIFMPNIITIPHNFFFFYKC